MNVELLKEFCEKIIENENAYSVQAALDSLRSAMEALASNPQDQNQQQNVATSLSNLNKAAFSFEGNFSHKEKEKLAEIKGYKYLSSDFVNDIKKTISDNPLSPAVARDLINGVAKKRQQYVENLKNLVTSLEKIGIEYEYVEESNAEIGFQIPREIFNNNLDGLITELRAIRNIIRTFSEVTTGSAEEIKIGQISTTDPLIFLAQSVPVILAVTKSVDWCLAKWREVEEIRQIRAQTTQIKHFTKKDIEMFDKKITAVIEKGIEEKVNEILGKSDLDKTRKNELQKALTDALESLFSRIERGMTLELRMLPYEDGQEGDSEEPSDSQANPETSQLKRALEELDNIQTQLKFPPPDKDPILKLTKPSNTTEDQTYQDSAE